MSLKYEIRYASHPVVDVNSFLSHCATQPAKFYFSSAPAHKPFPTRKITKADAVVLELGSFETSDK